jgi:hypothetical protein
MRTIPTGSPLTCAVTCQRHSRSLPGLQPAPPRTPRARNSAAMIETRRNAASPPMTSPVAAARVIGSWTMRPRAPGVKLNSGAHRARNEWPLACAAHNPRKPLLPREWPVRVHPSRLRYRWSCSLNAVTTGVNGVIALALAPFDRPLAHKPAYTCSVIAAKACPSICCTAFVPEIGRARPRSPEGQGRGDGPILVAAAQT